MNTKEITTLLPIGTRVTHWDGKRGSTHGKGTIIAYNGVSPSSYIRENFTEAVNMAAKAGLLNGLAGAMYDGQRYPYVVQFDPREAYEGESERSIEMRLNYPRGYKDVYGVEDTNAIEPYESIFTRAGAMIMMRKWDVENKKWDPWVEGSGLQYMTYKDDKDFQFCLHPEF